MRAVMIGQPDAGELATLEAAAARAQAVLHAMPTAQAQALLTQDEAPNCLVLSAEVPAVDFIEWLRDHPRLAGVPVLVLVPYPTDALFRQAYAAGANDALVQGDLGGLTRRLANLASYSPAERPPADKGLAVIASSATAPRRLFGRTLRQAGFDVGFASDETELVDLAGSSRTPSLLVATPSFPPAGAKAAIEAARSAANDPALAAIVLPGDADRADFSAGQDTDPTSKLLFFADEVLKGSGKDLRASRRLLHATLCAFRQAGALDPIFGLTHNISREGLYVRTLDPPTPGVELWFEMRAPSSGTAIHLRGRVVWRRDVSHVGGASPPGFGLRIEAELCPPRDLASYQMAYDELLEVLDRATLPTGS